MRQWISEGSWPSGHLVPAERALSDSLQIDRRTLRKALDQLTEEGLLSQQSARRRVVSHRRNGPRPYLAKTIAVLAFKTEAGVNGAALAARRRAAGWNSSLSQGIIDTATAEGLNVLTLAAESLSEHALADILSDLPYGIAIPDMGGDPRVTQWARQLSQTGLPLVAYCASSDASRFDTVESDHAAGGELLSRWLFHAGFRRLLPVWPDDPRDYWLSARLSGHQRAAEQAGTTFCPPARFPVFPVSLEGEERFRAEVRYMAGFLAPHLMRTDRPEVLLAATDGNAFLLAAACRVLGILPGRDIMIAGYDNYWPDVEELAWEPSVPLVTVDKGNYAIGALMVRTLIERIEEGPSLKLRHTLFPPVVMPIPAPPER